MVIDHILRDESSADTPDFGMIDFNNSIASTLEISHDGRLRVVRRIANPRCLFGHAHRMTLIQAVINGLRDLRLDCSVI